MDEKTIKSAAFALAESTPDHAGKSASPPISFWMEGEDLVILCADYRKVRATPDQIKQIMANVGAKHVSPPSPAQVMPAQLQHAQVPLPTHVSPALHVIPPSSPAPPVPERGKPVQISPPKVKRTVQ